MDITITNSQTVLSIGPGQLGIERGIESVIGPLQVAAYVEIEAFIIQNLIALMEKGMVAPAPIWADVKTFPYRRFCNKVHGITAGYPCQPFSIAGKRKGANDPRHLWPHIYRIHQTIRPFWAFYENVADHLSLGYEEVSRDLRKAGYAVEEGLYSAAEVGAPHQRKRLFILAVENSYLKRMRRCSVEGGLRQVKIQTSGPGQLGHSQSTDQLWNWLRAQYENLQVGRSGIKLAHTDSVRSGTGNRNLADKSRKTEDKARRTNRQRCRDDIGHSHQTMADTASPDGSQIRKKQETSRSGNDGPFWPAGPGPQQYDWEKPRTLESSLGCTVDGYNFREDLLRMFGNGVVPQTAALAWSDLWEKHLKNLMLK